MHIRAMNDGDIEAVVALWRACGLTRPWNDPCADIALACSAGNTSTILLAFEGERLMATVMVGFDGHRGWVYYLAVTPDAQRTGIGRRMMQEAEKWLVARNAPKIQLMVREDNDAVSAFYRAIGYEVQPVTTIGKRF